MYQSTVTQVKFYSTCTLLEYFCTVSILSTKCISEGNILFFLINIYLADSYMLLSYRGAVKT